ncbi:transposase [Geothrix sp. PMB-07]|uniref:helix-turn-helix domain-containing protein n=1 Tax=Geothrix sp. PMB-07 TaxID=3068640 RepID=UPI00355813DD
MLPKHQRNLLGTDPTPRSLERHRVLQEADVIGSVTEVCQRAGVTRPTFYLWKKRYAASGMLGLEDCPRKPSPGRPPKVNAAIRSALIEHVRRDPQAGCLSLAKQLTELGVRISSPTVQKYLNRWGLGSQQARKEWVRRGCPLVEASCPLPDPDLPGLVSYESAKSYYFLGIPRRDGGGREILRPSIEEVAQALGVLPAGIQVIADREHWVERRERLLSQIRAFEIEEEIHKTLARLDSTTITAAALGLKKVMDIVRSHSGEVTPLKNLMAAKTLNRCYRVFKRPFGTKLPVLIGPTRSGEFTELENCCSAGSGTRGRGSRLLTCPREIGPARMRLPLSKGGQVAGQTIFRGTDHPSIETA